MIEAVCETLDTYLALGNAWSETPDAAFVTCPEAPRIRDANHVCRVRAESPEAVAGVLEEAERRFAGLRHRMFFCDPRTPAPFEARLALEDYRRDADLQLLLEGELRAAPPRVEIRAAEDDADWARIEVLTRLDHEEEMKLEQRPVTDLEVTRHLVGRRRAKGPELTTWLARVDGTDCACFSSWPGRNGVGKVEDLYTHPDFRRRGIATALIAHAVDAARQGGASAVVIGARTDDHPKRLYARLGFRPLLLRRSWLRILPTEA